MRFLIIGLCLLSSYFTLSLGAGVVNRSVPSFNLYSLSSFSGHNFMNTSCHQNRHSVNETSASFSLKV